MFAHLYSSCAVWELQLLLSLGAVSLYQDYELLGAQSELIPQAVELARPWVLRLSCLVVGPGLGDDPLVTETARRLIEWEGYCLGPTQHAPVSQWL